jgi:hypothetical protein
MSLQVSAAMRELAHLREHADQWEQSLADTLEQQVRRPLYQMIIDVMASAMFGIGGV